MHYFFKPKNNQNLKINLSENDQTNVNEEQNQKPPLRKIIVKKKNKKSLQEITDNIFQTQSQHFVQLESQKDKQIEKFNQNRETKKKLKPFISFMASQNQSYEELQTPYLHGPSPSYNLESIKMNVEPFPIEEADDVKQRMIERIKSKPIEQISLQNPNKKNLGLLMRRNSMKSDFQSFNKKPNKYPTEIFSEKDDYSSMYQRSKQGSRPRLSKKQNKEEKISVLQDQFSQNINSFQFIQPKNTQSTKFLLRKDSLGGQNQSLGYLNNEQGIGRKSVNQFQSKLSAAIQSSQSESESQQPQQLTSRIQIPVETYIISKPSGYTSYIELQSRQLEEQQKRMNFYAQETNKLLCNVQSYQSPIKDESIIDKHYNPLKYMMEELVELFCMGEVIKFQLKYRSFQILNKVYAEASKYYQQKIIIEDPIKAYTFSLALKALLPQYQKSQLDIVISKIFDSNHLLSFQNFSLQLQPLLNSKIVSLLQPQSMKKELDKTLQKAKRLFYFTKKIREILRSSKIVYDSIILECSSIEQPSRLDIQLLQKYFLQGQKKNYLKKLKLDVFFRNTIGNDLSKSNWSDWIYRQEVRLYNRYEGKAVFERLNYESRSDRRQTYIKANLNSRKNEDQLTSIMNTSRKISARHLRNF